MMHQARRGQPIKHNIWRQWHCWWFWSHHTKSLRWCWSHGSWLAFIYVSSIWWLGTSLKPSNQQKFCWHLWLNKFMLLLWLLVIPVTVVTNRIG
jgi:hypothetical protein